MIRIAEDQTERVIVLPASDVPAMEAEGFTSVPCAQKFRSKRQQEIYRDTVCALAADLPPARQERFRQTVGERPAVLCGMAEAILGPWVREELR